MQYKRSSSDSDNYHRFDNETEVFQKRRYDNQQFEQNVTFNNPLSLTSKSKRERMEREAIERNNQGYQKSHRFDSYYEPHIPKEDRSRIRHKNTDSNREFDETKRNERHSHKHKEHSDKHEIRKHKKSRDHKDRSKRDTHRSRSKKVDKRRKNVDDGERECSNDPCKYDTANVDNDSDTDEDVLQEQLLTHTILEHYAGTKAAHSPVFEDKLDLVSDKELEDCEENENSVDEDDFSARESSAENIENGDYNDYHNVRSKFESGSLDECDMGDDRNDSHDNDSQSDSGNSASSYGSSISSSRNPKKLKLKKQLSKEENDVERLVFSPVLEPEKLEEMDVDRRPLYYPAVQGCRLVEEFECLNKIEEGTYGVVFRARDRRTDEIVALKRLKMEKERDGFPITSLREINTLMKARHVNIVTVREVVVGSNMDKIYLVMDFIEHDLKSLMLSMVKPFEICEVKCLMRQLLNAVAHLHDNWILHRDLKTSNLLLSHRGILKVADFGLAREYGSPLQNYTRVVVTLWYRAPELLLGTKTYSTQIDLWSVGCIFGELLLMAPLFPGKSEMDQISILFRELGTPSEKIWPGFSSLPNVKRFEFGKHDYNRLGRRFGALLSESGQELANRLLAYCPERRITAMEALRHPYFLETPVAISPEMFPTRPAKSEGGLVTRPLLMASPKPPSGGGQGMKYLNDDRFLALGPTRMSRA